TSMDDLDPLDLVELSPSSALTLERRARPVAAEGGAELFVSRFGIDTALMRSVEVLQCRPLSAHDARLELAARALTRGYQSLAQARLRRGAPIVYSVSRAPLIGADLLTGAGGNPASPTVVLERLHGTSSPARQPLRDEASWRAAAWRLWQLCYVMSQAHARQVVHLNLHPGALRERPQGLVIERWEAAQRLATVPAEPLPPSLRLSASFTAPELMEGAAASTQADVYSLGALSFWLLTGEAPPRRHEAARAALDAARATPPAWVDATLAALSPAPRDRPKTAAQLYARLFGTLPRPAGLSAREQETMELSLDPLARRLALAQMAFEAGVPLGWVEDEGADAPAALAHLGLAPLATLTLSGLDGAQGASATPLGAAGAAPRALQERQQLPAGLYALRWARDGQLLEWRLALKPLQERRFDLAFPPSRLGWLYVPAGPAFVGAREAAVGKVALHEVTLDPFWLRARRITVEEYRAFLRACPPLEAERRAPLSPLGHPKDAVLGVSVEDAQAFARWRGEGERLPSPDEWEKAMRGESAVESLAEWLDGRPAPLEGIADGAGELCLSPQGAACVKGGAWSFGRLSCRVPAAPDIKYAGVGFRVAVGG
ncbi:MAG: hypothetical protein FJ138_15860, partial [Deltaproteobacteria bacterium]|nr:hypothetical protein [Deltaproteobacteria bacterium]